MQQVVPPEHMLCLSHFSLPLGKVRAAILDTHGTGSMEAEGSSHVLASRLHTVPCGQQWMWSSQHTALGRGQQAHSPAGVLQQVALPGQEVESSHLLLGVSDAQVKAGTLASQGTTALPEGSSHVLAARLQMVPWGQQWRKSSQQTALGRGQQAHSPCWVLQHVLPSAQATESLQGTAFTVFCSVVTGTLAGILVAMAVSPWADVHMLWVRSHVVSLGQQWMWSEQHTALGMGQQP